MSNFYIFFLWFTLFFCVGLIFLPLGLRTINNKGIFTWIFSKVVGLLLFVYTVWLLLHLKFITNYQIILGVTVFGCITFNLYLFIKDKNNIFSYIKSYLPKIAIFEFFFSINSLMYLIYRSINPKVEGIEKIMDQAVLNTLIKTLVMPPIDIWYSQTKFQYYYFGQFIYAVITKILNTPLDLAYNIAISYSFGLSMAVILGVVLLLIKNKYFAILATFIVMLGGNLDYIYKIYFLKKSDYFFAEARSLIEFAITEFPAYSVILGDLHAHFLNIPFVIFYVGLSYLYFSQKMNRYFFILMGFTLGIFFMVNSWDYIIYGLLTTIIYVSRTLKNKKIRAELSTFLIIIGTSILTLAPFKLNFNAAVSGIGFNTKFTSPQAFALMFGHFLILFIIYKILKKILKNKNDDRFINILFVFAVSLIIISEFTFIKDIYYTANPPYFRANTIFKFWYQAFIVFGIISTYCLYSLIKLKKVGVILIALLFLSVFGLNIMYTYKGISYYFKVSPKNERGLSGTKYLENQSLTNELLAINYLNKNVKNQVIILEKPGDSYTTDSLFSAYTGNPTVVGWINHEFGWQGQWDPIAKTLGDIQLIYTSTDETQVKELARKYKIEYVIIGTKEITKYGENTGKTIENIGKVFYKNDTVKIIKIS